MMIIGLHITLIELCLGPISSFLHCISMQLFSAANFQAQFLRIIPQDEVVISSR